MGWEGPVTYRQFRTWQVWLNQQWNRPSREDHYLMAIACEVRRVLSKNPNHIQPSDFVLRFQTATEPSTTYNNGDVNSSKCVDTTSQNDETVEDTNTEEGEFKIKYPKRLTMEQAIEGNKKLWMHRVMGSRRQR